MANASSAVANQQKQLRPSDRALRSLAAVEPHEVRRHSPYGRIVVARGLAFRTLDFDDARAGVGKGNGAEGCRHGLLNRNDQQPPRVSRRDNLREGQTFR
jgi:hypothetical protein